MKKFGYSESVIHARSTVFSMLLVALSFCLGNFQIALGAVFSVGPREIVMDAEDRNSKGLNYWPDGTMGVIRSGSQYAFFTANSSSIARTVGTPDNPAVSVLEASSLIQNMKNSYNYTAGGPVYRDPSTGTLYMFYHAEKWDGDFVNFWSLIGMAKSTDGGNTWNDLGEIVTPNCPFGSRNHEITGGTFVIVGDYFYLYFRDCVAGSEINLAVARARVDDVMTAANSNNVTVWTKYRNGNWSQPGIGGTSSGLESGNPWTNFMSVSYNEHSGKYILVVVCSGNNWDLCITESSDGLSWSTRVKIDSEMGESYAPSIVGFGTEPRNSGQQFYVYYSYSLAGGFNRWSDSVFSRRLISLDGQVNPPPTQPPSSTPPNGLIVSYAFDEASGTTVASDSSGNGINARLMNGPTLVTGKYGNALKLDGVDDYGSVLSVGSLPAYNTAQTISLWYRVVTNPTGTQQLIVLQNLNNTALQLEFRNGMLGVGGWGGSSLVRTAPPTANTWHHLAYTFDGTTHRLYVDGTLQTTSTTAPQPGTPNQIYFGTYSGLNEFFSGQLDDVRVYSGALSEAAIQADMKTPIGGIAPITYTPAAPTNLLIQ
jgi:Concanavalin A-like lectin/glucanases superfamily/Domain of unknown function (DUF4185)